MGRLNLKRAYDPPSRSDGSRVLVDRLWPRGIGKEELRIDLWAKDLAPSAGLRKWFGHDPAKWKEFTRRYHAELGQNPDAIGPVLALMRQGDVTLVFAAKDAEISNAAALKQYLEHPEPGRGRRR